MKRPIKYSHTLFFIFALLLAQSVTVVFAQDADDTIAENVEALAEATEPEFTVLLQLLEAAELFNTLDDIGEAFTVFAPTDEAFEELLDEINIDLDDLLEDVALVDQVLRYHVVEGVVEAGDLEDGQEVETLLGATITISIDDETIFINDNAEVITADTANRNGIVHTIDAVLRPPQATGAACTVSTDDFNSARVRVGPGNNRTAVTFLEVDTIYEVLGRNEDDNGVVWYQLDKDESAPGRAINEAWVSSEQVETEGDCDTVGETSAPPLIPIAPQAPPPPSNDDGGDDEETTEDPETTADSAIQPASGTWTIIYAPTTDISCAGTQNVNVPTPELYGNTPTFTDPLSPTATGFTFSGVTFTDIGDNTYQGIISVEGVTGTIFIRANSTSNMTGRFIFSVEDCSATTNVTMTR